MYTFETRVRYSECGMNEHASLSGVLNYLQDVCTFQAEDLAVGVKYMQEHGLAWVLNSWQVDIERYPLFNESIKIVTWPYDFYGFYGFRNFKIEDAAGRVLIRANSVWVFMDMRRGRPVKIVPEIMEAYQKEEKLDMEYLDRKALDFSGGTAKDGIRIPHCFIDTNRHVNNVKYILTAQELLPSEFETVRMHTEYCRSAVYGQMLYPYILQEENKISVKLCDEFQKPYAVIEFYSKIG